MNLSRSQTEQERGSVKANKTKSSHDNHPSICGKSLSRDVNSGKLIKRIGIVGEDITSLKTAIALSIEEPRVLCTA
jgi:hypothetical protein